MAALSTYMCESSTSGVFFADFSKDFAPQFGGFQDVGFADGADFFAAFLGGLEGDVAMRRISLSLYFMVL